MTFERLMLADRIVVVTGAAGGIGAACVGLLAARGASVLAVDRAFPLAEQPRTVGGPVARIVADVATEDGWESIRSVVNDAQLPLRALVNGAGVIGRSTIAKTERGEWDRTMDVNLKGTWLGMRALGPVIGASGGGAVVNISSAAGLDHHPDAAYTASKWGVRGLTKTAAQELGPLGVRVNSIHPGYIDAGMGVATPDLARRAMISLLPLARAGQAEEVAELVAYLASDAAAYVTGAEIAIDGGWSSGVQAAAGRRLP